MRLIGPEQADMRMPVKARALPGITG